MSIFVLARCARIFVAATLLCATLQGCSWLFGIPNVVRQSSIDEAGVTQLAYGLDASEGDLSVALDWFDPITGTSGTCSRRDHTEANSPKGSSVTYFVFEVPPGAYVVSYFNTTGGSGGPDAPAYMVPAGKQSYVGTFAITGVHAPTRDLDAAKRALGTAADHLELADTFIPTNLQRTPVCSP